MALYITSIESRGLAPLQAVWINDSSENIGEIFGKVNTGKEIKTLFVVL